MRSFQSDVRFIAGFSYILVMLSSSPSKHVLQMRYYKLRCPRYVTLVPVRTLTETDMSATCHLRQPRGDILSKILAKGFLCADTSESCTVP